MVTVAARPAWVAAVDAERMVEAGRPLHEVWRFVILQLLDDYLSTMRHRGVAAAAAM